jgi:predicted GNAT superfamily acetyltransferase
MSLFAKYKKEREGKETLESEYGFATYFFHEDFCYLEDIFVDISHRQEGLAAKMADEISLIAKKKGYSKLMGSVNTNIGNVTTSIKVLLSYGMKFHGVQGHMLFFIKEI